MSFITASSGVKASIIRKGVLTVQVSLRRSACSNVYTSQLLRLKDHLKWVQGIENQKQPETLWITGSTGQIGKEIVRKGLRDGHKIVAVSRSSDACQVFGSHPNLKVLTLSLKEQQSPAVWERCMRTLSNSDQNIKFVHSLGLASGDDLMGTNYAPLEAVVTYLEKAQQRGDYKHIRVVDVNSLASSIHRAHLEKTGEYIIDPYIKSRIAAIELLREAALPNTMNLKTSYCCPDPKAGLYDMKHAWGPDQMANFFVQVVIGSGDQPVQPVFISSIVDAIFAYKKGKMEVDGVGIDKMTVKEFFSLFRELIGQKTRFFNLSYDDAMKVVELGPIGHVARYSVICSEILDKHKDLYLDSKPMVDLLGYHPDSINKLRQFKGQLRFPKPPYGAHMKQLISNANDRDKVLKLLKVVSSEAATLFTFMLKEILKSEAND